MLKEERKLIKLQKKAQECVSRKKAVKILTKAKKWQKCLKPYPIENDSHYPPCPHVKFCYNPLALRARSPNFMVEYRMFTVIHRMIRASEASGFSTVRAYCE